MYKTKSKPGEHTWRGRPQPLTPKETFPKTVGSFVPVSFQAQETTSLMFASQIRRSLQDFNPTAGEKSYRFHLLICIISSLRPGFLTPPLNGSLTGLYPVGVI